MSVVVKWRSCARLAPARLGHFFALIIGEAAALTLAGISVGLGLLYGLLLIDRPIIEARFGIYIALGGLALYELLLLSIVLLAGFMVGALPSYRAYKPSLAEGLAMRV